MIPYTIVLEPGLVIYKIYMGYWFFGRPTLEELRQDLRAVLRKCRPDWDITTPELKAAWQEDRKELFYPYGKTYGRTEAAIPKSPRRKTKCWTTDVLANEQCSLVKAGQNVVLFERSPNTNHSSSLS
jgi:hypothetical protein